MIVFAYAFLVFVSAGLIFLVQPMVSKALLPYLGGGPQIWNTALMVFQVLLLAGYAYAYSLMRWVHGRWQFLLHALLMVAITAWFFPLSFEHFSAENASRAPILWMISTLLGSVALPFFVLASTAPLMQHWFSCTTARNPYPLYSASNAGSLLALLAYPFVVERFFDLPQQTLGWSYGFLALAVLLLLVGGGSLRRCNPSTSHAAPLSSLDDVKPTLSRRLIWVGFSFLPCSLMMGVTSYITTDIASVPLFWVIPMLCYLASMIIVFAYAMPKFLANAYKSILPLAAIVAFLMLSSGGVAISLFMVWHILLFFLIAVCSHGVVVAHKPSAKYLGEFYLWMSLGGALGGVFNVVLAPQIFDGAHEYAIVLAVAILAITLQQQHKLNPREFFITSIIIGGVFAGLMLLFFLLQHDKEFLANIHQFFDDHKNTIGFVSSLTLLMAIPFFHLLWKWRNFPVRGAMVIASLLILPCIQFYVSENTLYSVRNFFGVYRVTFDTTRETHTALHNTTLHGIQSTRDADRLKVASYYRPVKTIYEAMPEQTKAHPIAMVGLGAGTTLCAFDAKQNVDIYEIDPDVPKIAGNPKFFTYVRDCPPQKNIIIGDARLMLQKAPKHHYGLMVLDAFSSDAIPIHTLTREALDMYFEKLAKGGVIAFHVSNRHLNLFPVFASYAKASGYAARYAAFKATKDTLELASLWVVLARHTRDLKPIEKAEARWEDISEMKTIPLWTDRYSNILAVLK